MNAGVELQLLIAAIGMIALGIASLAVAFLMARGSVVSQKWFGSVRFHVALGIFGLVSGLLNLGRIVVPPERAEAFATFSLLTTALLIVGAIAMAVTSWRVG